MEGPTVDPNNGGAFEGIPFTDATGELLRQFYKGDVSGIGQYVTLHLGPALLYSTAGLAIIFGGYLVAKYLARVVSQPVCRRVDETLGRFVGRVIFYCIVLAVTAAVLTKMGAPLGGLAAMLAAAGFAIGLAFQGTLSNFAAGILMLVFRPFKVGDIISAGGVKGEVNEIDLFTTTLDTVDNRRIIIPNSAISGGVIENHSFHPHRRVEVVVGVDYAADQDQTRAALEAATLTLSANTIPGPERGASVVLSKLGDNAVEWKVRIWVPGKDYWEMLEALTSEVKRHLDDAQIGIPFPQLDVHLMADDPAAEQPIPRPRVRPARRTGGSVATFDSLSRAS